MKVREDDFHLSEVILSKQEVILFLIEIACSLQSPPPAIEYIRVTNLTPKWLFHIEKKFAAIKEGKQSDLWFTMG